MKKGKFSIGTDPEFFIRREGKLVSAIPFLTGTKMNPQRIGKGIGLSFDNVALEFSSPVCKTDREFVHMIKECFRSVLKVIPKFLTLDTVPAAYFPPEELEHEESKQFGCDPDFCAWTLKMNKPPDRTGSETLRSCGGHVHVGHKEGYDFLLDPFGKILTVQAMDICLGIVSIMLDTHIMSGIRRKLYGKAGCHRPTDYGVEYRTLSNFWLKHPKLVKLIHSLTQDALDLVQDGKLKEVITCLTEDLIKRIINTGDIQTARFVYEKQIKQHLSFKSNNLIDECLLLEKKSTIEDNWNVNVTRLVEA